MSLSNSQNAGGLSDAERRNVRGKHILTTGLKWAAFGALVLGAAAAVVPVMFAGTMAAGAPLWLSGPMVGGWLTNIPLLAGPLNGAMSFVGGTALSWATSGAMWGAAGAGVAGLFKGFSSADDAVADAEEDMQALAMQKINRQQKLVALKKMQQQQMENMQAMESQYGLAQTGLPRGRGTGQGAEIS